ILDPRRELVLTELTRSAQGTSSIKLPPGQYRIRKRESHQVRWVDVTVGPGQTVEVRDDAMRVAPLEARAAKGGPTLVHGPAAWGGVRSGLVSTMGPTAE